MSTLSTAQGARIHDGMRASFAEVVRGVELANAPTSRDESERSSSFKLAEERQLFAAIGRLTRELHDAMRALDAQHSSATQMGSIRQSNLDSLVASADRATQRTFDLVERAMPVAETLARDVRDASERAARVATPQTISQLALHLEQSTLRAEQLQALLTDIFIAQDAQNQARPITRGLVNLFRSMEDKLISLLCVGADIDDANDLARRVTSNAWAGVERDNVMLADRDGRGTSRCDDKVDDLLLRLGF